MAPTTNARPIRVALIEDDSFFSAALRQVVQATPWLSLAAQAHTLAQGMALLQGEPADVLLVDLGLPDGSGIELIRAAREAWPRSEVMVLTVFGDEANVIQSIEAGAAGYLLKGGTTSAIAEQIRELHNGGSPISPRIARLVLGKFSKPEPATNPNEELLSARERQVLDRIVKGHTCEEIAGMMEISAHTVRTYIRRIYAKFEVCSKIDAINKAREYGFVRD